MKRSFFNKIKGLIGLLLLIGVGVGIFYWESYGRETLIYQDVLVLSESVERNVPITEDMIEWVKRDKEALIDDPVIDPSEIIGLEAKHFIPKNTQLSQRYFDDPVVILEDDQLIFKLPNEWIKAFPSSLRRKDVAFLYPILATENVDISKISVGTANKESLFKVVVAYVKDSANKEVVSVVGSRSDGTFADERLDGSSNIQSIEVIVTVDQVNEIKKLREGGYDFILLYQD